MSDFKHHISHASIIYERSYQASTLARRLQKSSNLHTS